MRWIISLSVAIALCCGGLGNVAEAQHRHGHSHGGSYWGSGHYHYQPAHFDVHRGHLDYHPATTTFHATPGISIGGHQHGHQYYGGCGCAGAELMMTVRGCVTIGVSHAEP